MLNLIQDIRNAIYKQNEKLVIESIIKCLEEMSLLVVQMNHSQLKIYNENLILIDQYFNYGDYLAVSDVLLFEMMPLESEVRRNDYVLQ